MRKMLAALLCIVLLSGCAVMSQPEAHLGADDAYPYTFTDDLGNTVTLTRRPQTVAVLLSSLSDLWITAGGTVDITVGETVERGIVDVNVILVDEGAGKTINIETLVSAKPDLVIYSADLSGQLECADTLEAAQIPAAGFTVETFDEYLKVLKIFTDILGTPDRYKTYGTDVQTRINELLAIAAEQEEQPRILFVRAGSSAKVTKAKTAENHFVCAMLDQLGAYNIADDAAILLDGLSTEEILTADPDFIFFTTMGEEEAAVSYMNSLMDDPVWQSMTAVKEGHTYQLPKELFQYKPNARWAEAYEYLIKLIYGDIV